MITLNVVTTMRRIIEEEESVPDYGLTDLDMRLGVMNLTHHMLNVESICSSAVKATLESECQLTLVLTCSLKSYPSCVPLGEMLDTGVLDPAKLSQSEDKNCFVELVSLSHEADGVWVGHNEAWDISLIP